MGGEDVTDEAVACLTQLKALTALGLSCCSPLQGIRLGQLAAVSSLVSFDLHSSGLTTLQGLQHLPWLQHLELEELEPAALAPLSALTALTRLDASSSHITDECSALLRLPSLASLTIYSILLTAPIAAAGSLPQLTYLEVLGSGSLPHLLPLPKLQELRIPHTADISADDAASLAPQISKQTSLTRLELWRLSQQQMQQVAAPLKNLQSSNAPFAEGETSCLAACAALAELTLLHVPQPPHLAMLVRCERLEVLRLTWAGSTRGVSTGCWLRCCASPACAGCSTRGVAVP